MFSRLTPARGASGGGGLKASLEAAGGAVHYEQRSVSLSPAKNSNNARQGKRKSWLVH